MDKLDKIVTEMKGLGEFLVDFTYPQASSKEEDQISVLKSREIMIDGYEIGVHYSKSETDDRYLECLQCFGLHSPFLPFAIVVKVARKFLGDEHLCFIDVYQNNKKTYCWTVSVDESGLALPPEQEIARGMEYEGFRFDYMNSKSVNFF